MVVVAHWCYSHAPKTTAEPTPQNTRIHTEQVRGRIRGEDFIKGGLSEKLQSVNEEALRI